MRLSQLETPDAIIHPPDLEISQTPEKANDNPLSFAKFLNLHSQFSAQGIKIHYLTAENTENLPEEMRDKIAQPIRDYEGGRTPFTIKLTTRNPESAAHLAIQNNCLIATLGAGTSSDTMGKEGHDYGNSAIIAISQENALKIEKVDQSKTYPEFNEYWIEKDGDNVTHVVVGCSVNIAELEEQIANILPRTLKNKYRLCLPVDPTTKRSAHMSALLATGAQGTTRYRLSDITEEVTYFDGTEVKVAKGEEINKLAGMLGNTGQILAVKLRVFEAPKNKFGIFVPLQKTTGNESEQYWADAEAEVIGNLHNNFPDPQLKDRRLTSAWKNGIIEGAEEVSLTPLEKSTKDGNAAEWIEQMKTESNGHAIYFNGSTIEEISTVQIDTLLKYPYRKVAAIFFNDERTIDQQAGILEGEAYSEIPAEIPEPDLTNPIEKIVYLYLTGRIGKPTFYHSANDSETLLRNEQARESSPLGVKAEFLAARNNPNKIVYSKSSDINTTISAAKLAALHELSEGGEDITAELIRLTRAQLEPYVTYSKAISELKAEAAEDQFANRISVNHYAYGHLNPKGINKHDRVTIIGDLEGLTAENDINYVRNKTKELIKKATAAKKTLTKNLLALRETSNGDLDVSCGEKGTLTKENPALLTAAQRLATMQALEQSHPSMNWRGLETLAA